MYTRMKKIMRFCSADNEPMEYAASPEAVTLAIDEKVLEFDFSFFTDRSQSIR